MLKRLVPARKLEQQLQCMHPRERIGRIQQTPRQRENARPLRSPPLQHRQSSQQIPANAQVGVLFGRPQQQAATGLDRLLVCSYRMFQHVGELRPGSPVSNSQPL